MNSPTASYLYEAASEGIQAEMRMLDSVRRGDAAILGMTWQARRNALVMPASMTRKPWFGALAERAEALGHPVALRQTGGGLVPQGPGIFNLAFAYRRRVFADFTLECGYDAIVQPLMTVFGKHGLVVQTGALPGSFCDGKFNLLAGGRKLVGTAQRWSAADREGEHSILGHAVIAYDMDVGNRMNVLNRICEGSGACETGVGGFDPLVHTSIVGEFTRQRRIPPSQESLCELILGEVLNNLVPLVTTVTRPCYEDRSDRSDFIMKEETSHDYSKQHY